ncbi:hypothetical protein [Lentibacillus sediminis]|uniref:hypothetical protein n=1 Tax=Lentibacillus sediminis TaxID=1940529 RepID=UPI000C1C4373|nr:hypothetical protein [Lentibacillus sediminis]
MSKSYEEVTAADRTSVGFEYQHYYFIYRLLKLKKDESIGYEVKDDVHIENIDGTDELVQVKHTLKVNSDGGAANLTELDIDLWKTLRNWLNLIIEKDDPISFLANTSFLIATNKNDSKRNRFLNKIKKYNEDEIHFENVYLYMKELIDKTKSSNIKEEIRYVLKTEKKLLALFLKKIKFDLSLEDLIEMIEYKIKDNYVSEERVKDVFTCIEGNLRLWKYDVVKKGKKIIISKEMATKKLQKCFEDARRNILPQREIDTYIDNVQELKDLPFIQELIEINDIDIDDHTEMIRYNSQMLKLKNNLNQWLTEGHLTEIDQKRFWEDSYNRWHSIHKRSHRRTRKINGLQKTPDQEQKLIDAALNCLDDTRDINLQVDGTTLTSDMSNGNYYHMSNNKEIGWKVEWEDRYR